MELVTEIQKLKKIQVAYDKQAQLHAQDKASLATLMAESEVLRMRMEALERTNELMEATSQVQEVMQMQQLKEYKTKLHLTFFGL